MLYDLVSSWCHLFRQANRFRLRERFKALKDNCEDFHGFQEDFIYMTHIHNPKKKNREINYFFSLHSYYAELKSHFETEEKRVKMLINSNCVPQFNQNTFAIMQIYSNIVFMAFVSVYRFDERIQLIKCRFGHPSVGKYFFWPTITHSVYIFIEEFKMMHSILFCKWRTEYTLLVFIHAKSMFCRLWFHISY